jgi:hypothetical protein
MCWSTEVSALSAVGAWVVCMYLYRRNLNFDRWAAGYLFTFTLTQVVDIALWLEEGRTGLATCSNINYGEGGIYTFLYSHTHKHNHRHRHTHIDIDIHTYMRNPFPHLLLSLISPPTRYAMSHRHIQGRDTSGGFPAAFRAVPVPE